MFVTTAVKLLHCTVQTTLSSTSRMIEGASTEQTFILTPPGRCRRRKGPTAGACHRCFWNGSYEMATRDFPDLAMRPPAFARGQTWLDLRPMDMPTRPRVGVPLKGFLGFIDLTFAGVLSRRFSPLVHPLLHRDMTVHQTGKSAAIRLVVESFKVSAVDEMALSKLRSAFASCVLLIHFYQTNQEVLDKAA
jgi:hypothetical protein